MKKSESKKALDALNALVDHGGKSPEYKAAIERLPAARQRRIKAARQRIMKAAQ